MKQYTQQNLNDLSAQAQQAPRLRSHQNIHAELEDPIQRLFIAFEPHTYVRPHRHSEAGKWECFALLEGHLSLLVFDDEGTLLKRVELATDQTRVTEIPPNTWHTLVCFASGTKAMEIKPGPYIQPTAKDFAAWAPAEGEPAASAALRWFEAAQPGDRVPASWPLETT